MSKNLTRKGLAFGAFVALASSAFAGTPATAAVSDSIVTGLASGTSYNSVVGYDNELKLSTTLAPSNATNETTLHYRIENPSGAKLEIGLANTTTSTIALTTTGSSSNTGEVWATAGTALSAVDADSVRANMQTALTSFNVIPLGNKVGESSDENFITIGVADADVNVEVTVYAWLDSSANASNVQQDTELYGNSVTLKFYDQANVTATTELVSPVTGAASVQATFTTTPELNGQQLGADFIDASVTSQGNGNAVLAKNTSSDAAVSPTLGTTTYSGTTKKWTSTAYLKYAKANDAFNGTDSSVTATIDLAASTAGTVQTTATTYVTTIDGKVTGLGDTNAGSFAVTIDGLDATGSSSTDVDDADVVATAITITDANTFVFTPVAGIRSKFTANATAQAIGVGVAQFWSVGTNATVQASGTYSFRPYIGTTALGAAGSSATSSITADDTEASIAVSTDVAEGYNDDASANTNTGDTVEVRTGTTTVSASAVIYYTDAVTGVVKTAPAGIPVTGYLTADNGTFQINASGAGVTSDVEYTDANGAVKFTVTTTTATSTSNKATLEIRPQSIASNNAAGAKFTLEWDDAAYTLYDLKSSTAQPGSNASSYRRITSGGSYTYDFAVLDQWGKVADAAKYRLQVVNSGRTVSSNTHTLSNGRVSVAVADGAQGSGSTIQTTVNLQKDVSGTWTTQATESWDGTGFGYSVINVAAATTEAFTLDADGGTTYQSSYQALTADLVDAIAAVKTAAQDRRTSAAINPATDYANAVTLNGRLSDKVTGQALGGGLVTISGDSSILFSSGSVDAFGSITVLADADGDFGVNLYSNKSATDTVITFTSATGATKTQKVTFSAATARSGKTLVISAPAVAKSGRTLTISGLLTDKWGNGVDTDQDATKVAGDSTLDAADARLVVTFTGPGLVSSSLPVETDADGKFTVRVLLGVNDSGVATVKATYGAANGTISAADTGTSIDVTASASSLVGVSATVAAAKKAASVLVKGAEGQTVTVVSGTKSVTKIATSDSFKVSLTKLTAGKKTVKVYVNDVLITSKSVTVKK